MREQPNKALEMEPLARGRGRRLPSAPRPPPALSQGCPSGCPSVQMRGEGERDCLQLLQAENGCTPGVPNTRGGRRSIREGAKPQGTDKPQRRAVAAAVPALGWGAGPSSRSAGVLPGPAADLLRQQIAALARPPWLQTAPGLRCLHNPSTAATQPRQAAAPAWHRPRSTPPSPPGERRCRVRSRPHAT